MSLVPEGFGDSRGRSSGGDVPYGNSDEVYVGRVDVTAPYGRVIEDLSDAFFVVRETGLVEQANGAGRELFRALARDRGETIEGGLGPHRLVEWLPELGRMLRSVRDEGVEPGDPLDREFEIQISGHTRHYRASLYCIDQGDAEEKTLALVFADASRHSESEQATRELGAQIREAQKLDSLGVLAGGVAHRFNNMLLEILGGADLALMELPRESLVRASIERIQETAFRAADLTKEMLAYAGTTGGPRVRFNVSRLINDMEHMLESLVNDRTVLRFDHATMLPSICGDPEQVRQVIVNLVQNAAEAVGEKSGTVTIRTGVTNIDREYLETTTFFAEPPDVDSYVYVEVSDTGRGMDEETRGRVFEPFFTTKFMGRGLGLSATLGIIRSHKGAIKVYTEPRRGTAVKVLLPSAAECAEEQLALSEEEIPERGTVLVAEDEVAVAAVLRRVLEKHSFDVLVACDGLEAVEVFEEFQDQIDAVLLDLVMPRMGGLGAFREIRRADPDVPIVLSSGYSEREVLTDFSGRDVAAFIQKPYAPVDLIRTLDRVMRKDHRPEA